MKQGRNVAEFVMLFVANGVMLWFFRGYFNLLIAVVMILLLLYAIISVHVIKRYISLQIEMPVETFSKNTEFFVRICLNNPCFLPLVTAKVHLRTGNTFLGEMSENILDLPLPPRDQVEVQYPLKSTYVGEIEVWADQIELRDILGFHKVLIPVETGGKVSILPAGNGKKEFVLNDYETGMDEVEESTLSGSDFSDVSQIREYIPGDAIKNIHWKLSAKRETLMVKERFHMSSRKLLIVLSLDRERTEETDRDVELLFSFGLFCLANRIPITIFWWSERFREGREETAESEEDWKRLMGRLFYELAGDGYVEEYFQREHPGKGYVLVKNNDVCSMG